MGKADVAMNQMMRRKEIFADFVNGIVYHGKQVLKPEGLECISGQPGILYEAASGKVRALERRRDIQMKADMGMYSVIFAEENQSRVHYAMPVRNMLYDALEYVRQVQEMEKSHRKRGELRKGEEFLSGITKEDRLTPVITIVFYFGGEWDGSRSLYEMMGWNEEGAWRKELETYLPNYKMNLVDAGNVENTNVFTSCLQQIFDMLKCRKDKKKLYQYVRENRKELMQMDHVELTAAMVMMGEQKRLMRILEEKGEEEFEMCLEIQTFGFPHTYKLLSYPNLFYKTPTLWEYKPLKGLDFLYHFIPQKSTKEPSGFFHFGETFASFSHSNVANAFRSSSVVISR